MRTDRIDDLLKKFTEQENPTDDELLKIIFRWDSPVKEKAWQKLRERRNNDSMVLLITNHASFDREAWLILKEENPSKNQLMAIIRALSNVPIRGEATFRLLEQNPDENILRSLVKSDWGWPTGEKAAQMLIAKNPDEINLKFIYDIYGKQCPHSSLGREVEAMLLALSEGTDL